MEANSQLRHMLREAVLKVNEAKLKQNEETEIARKEYEIREAAIEAAPTPMEDRVDLRSTGQKIQDNVQKFTTNLPSFVDFDTNSNNYIREESSVGQAVGSYMLKRQLGEVDPTFNPYADKELFQRATQNLTTGEIEDVIKNYSYNKGKFIEATNELQGRAARRGEINNYMAVNPGTGMANMLAAMTVFEPTNFIPTTGVVKVAAASLKGAQAFKNAIKGVQAVNAADKALDAARLMKPTMALATEALAISGAIQTGVEYLNSSYKGTEFDHSALALGMVLENGMSNALSVKRFYKHQKNALQNINLFNSPTGNFVGWNSKDSPTIAKGFVNQIDGDKKISMLAKMDQSKKAIDFDVRLNLEETMQDLVEQHDGFDASIELAKKELKDAKDPLVKQQFKESISSLKKQKKDTAAAIKDHRAKTDIETYELDNGTHREFRNAENPKVLKMQELADELGIDAKHLETPEEMAKYFGIDGKPLVSARIISKNADGTIDPIDHILNQELARTEANNNVRWNMNESAKAVHGIMLNYMAENKLTNLVKKMADPDSDFSSFVGNMANYSSSETPIVRAVFNLFGGDGHGQTRNSRLGLFELKQKYQNKYGGSLKQAMVNQKRDLIEFTRKSFPEKFKDYYLDMGKAEKELFEINRDFGALGEADFVTKYGQEMFDQIIAPLLKVNDETNAAIIDDLLRFGVQGVEQKATKNFFSRGWDGNKAEAHATWSSKKNKFVPKPYLIESAKASINKTLTNAGKVIPEKELNDMAKKWASGVVNKRTGTQEFLNRDVKAALEKLAKELEAEGDASFILKDKEAATKAASKVRQKAIDSDNEVEKFLMRELNSRTPIDLNDTIEGTTLKFADLQDDDVIKTHLDWIDGMASRLAAGERGINDTNMFDSLIDKTYNDDLARLIEKESLEKARLIVKYGEDGAQSYIKALPDPVKTAERTRNVMADTISSFKGHRTPEKYAVTQSTDDVHKLLRLLSKFNYGIMLQTSPVQSIAEMGGLVVEGGATNVARGLLSGGYWRALKASYTGNMSHVTALTMEVTSASGIGWDRFTFGSKAAHVSNKIYEGGIMGVFEQVADISINAGTAMWLPIERSNRIFTANTLTNNMFRHFKGDERNLFDTIFGVGGMTNRTAQNINLGDYDETGKFVFNEMYYKIKDHMLNRTTLDANGNLLNLNLKEWDTEVAQELANSIVAQTNHILVTPDPLTRARWQNHPAGIVLSQYKSYNNNSRTKIIGHGLTSSVMGWNHGEKMEAYKFTQKVFWSTVLALGVGNLRTGMNNLGTDKENRFNDTGIVGAFAASLASSSYTGELTKGLDLGANLFMGHNVFNKYNSGIDNIFDVSGSPTGSLALGIGGVIKNTAQGVFQGDERSLDKAKNGALKINPICGIMGFKQICNALEEDIPRKSKKIKSWEEE